MMINWIIGWLVASVVATAALTAFLYIPAWLGKGHVDVVRMLGSYVVPWERAFTPGMVMHILIGLISGGFLALLYYITDFPMVPLTGAFLGLIHGILAMIVIGFLAGDHPMQRYRDRELRTALSQLLAHVVHGVCFVIVLAAFV